MASYPCLLKRIASPDSLLKFRDAPVGLGELVAYMRVVPIDWAAYAALGRDQTARAATSAFLSSGASTVPSKCGTRSQEREAFASLSSLCSVRHGGLA
jgi:hypothetical protein